MQEGPVPGDGASALEKTASLTNGRYNPSWFRLVRQIVIFLMGIGILLYAVVSQGHDIPFLVTGLVLIGIIPIEDALVRTHKRRDER